MHVRVRRFGKPDSVVVVESKLTKIEQFRRIIKDKFNVDVILQRLFYGGKLLEDGYTFHDYNIKLNDVIQLMVKAQPAVPVENGKTDSEQQNKDNVNEKNEKKNVYTDAKSMLYEIGDLIDMQDREQGAWLEGKIVRIVRNPNAPVPLNCHSTNSGTGENGKPDKDSDSENLPPESQPEKESPKKKKGIEYFFTKASAVKKKSTEKDTEQKSIDIEKSVDMNLLFKIQLDAENLYNLTRSLLSTHGIGGPLPVFTDDAAGKTPAKLFRTPLDLMRPSTSEIVRQKQQLQMDYNYYKGGSDRCFAVGDKVFYKVFKGNTLLGNRERFTVN